MSDLIKLLKLNDLPNHHGRTPGREIILSGDNYKKAIELIKELENKK